MLYYCIGDFVVCIYAILLHWRLCGMYFIRTYCIGDFVVSDIYLGIAALVTL